MSSTFTYLLASGALLAGVGLLYYYRKYRAEVQLNVKLTHQQRELTVQRERLMADNEKLRLATQHLQEANTTKDKFFSIIGHDLKSPLNTIIGFLHILNDHIEAFSLDELKNFAQTMNKSVSNLLALLDNLLQWSRSQTGIIEYNPSSIRLRELIDENIYLIVGHAGSKDIQLDIQVPDSFTVRADANMLNVILRNLLTNAVKFTRKGGLITIQTHHEDKHVGIAITDTGVGMSKERLQNLFKMNGMASDMGTAQEKGNGLGLLLCQEFAQRNRGYIHVESKLGEGSTFTLFLPRN